ncbi:MAG: DUF6599 family protein [Terracidiphilus sp.]
MRKFAIAVCCVVCCVACLAAHSQSKPQNPASAAHKPSAVTVDVPVPVSAKATALLPQIFSGWELSGSANPLTDAAQADAASAAALKEFDFTYGASAIYKRDGDTLTVRALRFTDESGAYGAYTFYRQNGWPKEDIGFGATSNNKRVLFWQGDTVVDATFSQITPMSAAEMRSLAHHLPVPRGNKAIPPPILLNLPQASLDKQTTHYALGPAGYTGAGGVLPAELIGFNLDAEAVTANYSLSSGPATLTLINYPTPQMAAGQEEKIRAYIKAGSHAQPAWPKPLADSDLASLEVRRSGPIVALVSGDAIPDESHKLIERVNYQDQLTAIPLPTESEVAKTGRLLFGIATLVVIGSAAAILLGLFLGGGRALYRIARGKPASSVYETEFIRLNLEK